MPEQTPSLASHVSDFDKRDALVSINTSATLLLPNNPQRIAWVASTPAVGTDLFIGWSNNNPTTFGIRYNSNSIAPFFCYGQIGATVGFEIWARVSAGPVSIYVVEFLYKPNRS